MDAQIITTAAEVATAEKTVAITSFLTFFILQLIGALWHYRVVCKDGRHLGGLWSYMTGEFGTTTAPMFAALLISSLLAAISGTADYINPELVSAVIESGQLPLTSMGLAYLIIQSGYSWDSSLNKVNSTPTPPAA